MNSQIAQFPQMKIDPRKNGDLSHILLGDHRIKPAT